MKLMAKHLAWSGSMFAAPLASLVLAACSGDEPAPATTPGASGGQTSNGTGGKMSAGTGGKGSGGTHASGGTAGTGGRGSGGTSGGSGTGGKGSGGVDGGTGGAGGDDGGLTEGGDGGCAPPLKLYYRYPGCGAAAKPVCLGPNNEGGLWTLCLCDGTMMTDAGWPTRPYRHYGACEGGVPGDASGD